MDRSIFNITFDICRSAQIGTQNRWQRVDAWANRTLHERRHHNSEEGTYVSISSQAFRNAFGRFFTQWSVTDIDTITSSRGFKRAVESCFPEGCTSPRNLAIIRNNFERVYVNQIIAGQMLGATATLATPFVIGRGIQLGGRVIDGVAKAFLVPVARVSPNKANQISNLSGRLFPRGSVPVIGVGVITLGVGVLAKSLYSAHKNGNLKNTEEALGRGAVGDELASAIVEDLTTGLNQHIERTSTNHLVSSYIELVSQAESQIVSNEELLGRLQRRRNQLAAEQDQSSAASRNLAEIDEALENLPLIIENLRQEQQNFQLMIAQLLETGGDQNLAESDHQGEVSPEIQLTGR